MFKLLSTSDDLKIQHPFCCIVSGPNGSDKSSFCIRFLRNLDALCTERNFDGTEKEEEEEEEKGEDSL